MALTSEYVAQRIEAKRLKQHQQWTKHRAEYAAAHAAARDAEIAMRVKYGDASWRHWSSRGEQARFDKLNARAYRAGKKLFDLLLQVSPRGEAWRTGAPAHWIYGALSWEDAVRPTSEPLSVTVPAPYGAARGLI